MSVHALYLLLIGVQLAAAVALTVGGLWQQFKSSVPAGLRGPAGTDPTATAVLQPDHPDLPSEYAGAYADLNHIDEWVRVGAPKEWSR